MVGFAVRWKVPFSTFAWAFAPKMLEIGLPRPRMIRSFLQDLCSGAVSRFSRCPVAGNHRRHFFHPTGSSTITIPDRIEKTKWETALDRFWRKLRLILRRARPISNIFGAKAHANVLQGTFSTDCKSNCIIIGLRRKKGKKQKGKSKKRKKKKTKKKIRSGRRPISEGTRLLFAGTISPMMCPVDGPTEGRHEKTRRKTRQHKKGGQRRS